MTTTTQAGGAPTLALRRVLLSTGIGCFEYEAEVDGDAVLPLPVKLGQVDDVLKSAVVYDAGGSVGSVSLPGLEPLAAVFRELPFNEADVGSLVALLGSLRGAEVKVGVAGRETVVGRVIGVHSEQAFSDGRAVTRHRLGLLTDKGAQQFILEDALFVEFADAKVRGQVEQALAAIAAHGERDRRTLAVKVTGTGRRKVRVAYVVETPLWKASYRLTMGDATAKAAHLQGWAILENMSGEDWKDVEVVLASGNPVTFRQSLYRSYYVPREEVAVEVGGRVLPKADTGTTTRRGRPEAAGGARSLNMLSKSAAPMAMAMAASAAPGPEGLVGGAAESAHFDYDGAGLEVGDASEGGSQVEFKVPGLVSVANGHSLMVPIIDREVPSERFALFQAGTHDRHPLATVSLTNDGETALPAGVATLFERSGAGVSYVGDARFAAMPAGETRLVSYALDTKVIVDRSSGGGDERTTRVSISKGEIRVERERRSTTTYTVRGPAREARKVVVEHPRESYGVLEGCDGLEQTATAVRIPVEVGAGAQVSREVGHLMSRTMSARMSAMDARNLNFYLSFDGVNGKPRKALEGLRALFEAVADRKRAVERAEAEVRESIAEQQRIAATVTTLGDSRNTEYGSRMLSKLAAAEDQIETGQKAVKAAKEALDAANEALAAGLASFD